MKRIINFSGGKSSALMTILEYNPNTDYVLFCDTGREHPKTYKFINDFEAFENIPIIKLGGSDSFDKFLMKRDYELIPNMMKRACTIELKVNIARRWARQNVGMSYINLIGFRADEKERVIKNKKRWQQVEQKFPLFERNINKESVNQYWMKKPYNLEIPSILGNCTLCFMKGKNNIINILRHDPSLAIPWIEDERKSAKKYGHTYLKDITIEQCLKISQMPNLFSNIDLNDLAPAYNCSCTS
jgi:hypothetical protein